MPTVSRFEDLKIWQEARQLVKDVYNFTKSSKDYDFNSQIRRAAISVMNNIAEGYERDGNKEFMRFLRISKGSCGEVRSMVYLAEDFEYCTEQQAIEIREFCFNLSKAIRKLISYLESKQ